MNKILVILPLLFVLSACQNSNEDDLVNISATIICKVGAFNNEITANSSASTKVENLTEEGIPSEEAMVPLVEDETSPQNQTPLVESSFLESESQRINTEINDLIISAGFEDDTDFRTALQNYNDTTDLENKIFEEAKAQCNAPDTRINAYLSVSFTETHITEYEEAPLEDASSNNTNEVLTEDGNTTEDVNQ